MADPRIKQIKIHTGVLKRILKETLMYHKEIKQNENRIQKMKDEGRDEYDIRKMHEVLQESHMMIPDCRKRLQAAVEDLKNRLNEADEDLSENTEYKDGMKQLQEAEAALAKDE